ncbi:MAG: shikimate kinase [Desulfocapsa sp.]|nr:shikimate kinase [Desulfocapsa sp.]
MADKHTKTNIVLIGMAGAGKSTVGRELAPLLGRGFVDVDSLIEEEQETLLQEVLKNLGVHGFRQVEENILLSMDYHDHVIATGGSAVYSRSGLEHLQRSSVLVFLDVPLPVLKKRVGDFSSRGLVKASDQSFDQVFTERHPLYLKYADLVIDCSDLSVAEICTSIQSQV